MALKKIEVHLDPCVCPVQSWKSEQRGCVGAREKSTRIPANCFAKELPSSFTIKTLLEQLSC